MKKYIKPSIEVIKLQTEDAILTGSGGDKTINFDITAGEQTESAWSKDKGMRRDKWQSKYLFILINGQKLVKG